MHHLPGLQLAWKWQPTYKSGYGATTMRREPRVGRVGSVADVKIAPGGSASVFVLHEGYAGRDGDDSRVAGTVTLILDGDAVIVVDPGMVASRDDLLAALATHGPQAGDVTDVVFSHHHPDHTVNAALFPAARIHVHWAVYVGDRWIDRDADGAELGPSVRLLRTPGHTAEDISTVASTPDDVFACTHTWWGANGPATVGRRPGARLARLGQRRAGQVRRRRAGAGGRAAGARLSLPAWEDGCRREPHGGSRRHIRVGYGVGRPR